MIFNELVNRGLIKQTTNADKLRDMLDNHQVTFYIGFDPTADSLHVGHLLQLVTAKRLMDAGHKPILVIGGATALIGDPSGKTDMRKMLTKQDITNNSIAFGRQFEKIFGQRIAGEDHKFLTTNNLMWFEELNFLQFLRDVGPHFSVNNMLRADSVKSRLENGLSFLEFNYMVMQAQDFFHLHQEENCILQIGGDDQWSNILAGIDLIHKKTGKQSFGLTLPLLVNSDGTKMGKTEKGAVWLDPNKTTPFELFQFWRNIEDGKVKQCINFFTDKIFSAFTELTDQFSNINEAKKFLAFEITKMVHGQESAEQALKQAESLFEGRDASVMDSTSITDGVHILDLVMKCGFAKSRTEARNLINGRGITINNEVLTDPTINVAKVIFGNELVMRKGKKHFCRLIIEDACPDPNS